MVDQGKTPADPIDGFAAAAISNMRQDRDKLTVKICAMLNIESASDRAAFGLELNRIADSYRLDLEASPYYGRPKKQRHALRALRKVLGETIQKMDLISAEYAVQLDAMLTPPEAHPYCGKSLMLEAGNLLPLLELAIDRFDRNYRPKLGRRADVPLEEAVRDLSDLLEDTTGQKPSVKQTKTTGAAPTLGSPQAKAIGKLLMTINTALTETAVANMIEKVKFSPCPSEGHLEEIWDSDPDAALKTSLLPNKHRD